MIKKILLAVLLTNTISSHAQDKQGIEIADSDQQYNVKTYKIKQNTGVLKLSLNEAIVEGYSGDEIIFEKNELLSSVDERSVGLQSIHPNGLVDNTGIGIYATKNLDVVEVKSLSQMNSDLIKVKVPKNMKIVFNHSSEFSENIIIKNISNEIEADMRFANLVLENVTGPVTAKSLNGNIEAKFGENIKGPIALVSVYGFVDIGLKPKSNADIKLSTKFGEVLTDPALNIKLRPDENNKMFKNTMDGKINAGGTAIQLKSDFGKIYIRSN